MNEPFKVTKKARPSRPMQKAPSELAEDSHSWAVSYADFLMVLLSFFILFFSMDKKERVNFIENFLANQDLAKEQKDQTGNPKRGALSAGTTKPIEPLPVEVRKLSQDIQGFYVDQQSVDRIVISFEDNIYRLGSFDLSEKDIQNLHGLLKKLEPYLKQVNITFVGHTDENKKFKKGNRYIGNNFDLSSLRATKALQNAVKLGFDPKHMYAQGVAENQRASRTLSLIVSPGGNRP